MMRQTKKDIDKKKKPIEPETDPDALDQETINILSKRKLLMGGIGTTPKKVRGSLAKFP